ncbi:MAG: cupin domain-containing protein [Clostridiales bacterium]|nr:cupin domain-containing protein [Clostridiales bacterium]
MEPKIIEIAQRIATLRDILGLSAEQMAQAAGVTTEEYLECEAGRRDFSFTFLYHCAERFGVDMIELLTGENPHLTGYTIVRAGKGLPIKRGRGFVYNHLAANFRGKIAEPFLVRAPYSEEEQTKPIEMNTHAGQEFNYVLEGSLRFAYRDKLETLNAGDSVYYDSGNGHGMIATGGRECVFLALVMKAEKED